MARSINKLLIVGAVLSEVAALMHLACLVAGAPLYRLLGAVEQVAQLHLARPPVSHRRHPGHKYMAGTACHALGSDTQLGLT